ELHLERVDDREVPVHDRVEERVEHVPGAVTEKVRLVLAARADIREPLLAPVSHRKHVVATDEDVHLADAQVVAVRLDRLDDGEERAPVLLDLRPLVAVAGILDGEGMEFELLLHLRQLRLAGVPERHPDEAVRSFHVFVDLARADLSEPLAVLISDAIDQHALLPRPSYSGPAEAGPRFRPRSSLRRRRACGP